jgi:hypothetical protein
MARNSAPAKKTPVPNPAVSSTPVRNSPIPKVAAAVAPTAAVKKVVTHDMIAVRAYEISCSGAGGSEFDNWLRAERELRGL